MSDESAIAAAFRRDGYQVARLSATVEAVSQLQRWLALHPQCIDLLVVDCTAGLPAAALDVLLGQTVVPMLLISDGPRTCAQCHHADRCAIVPRELDTVRTTAFDMYPPLQPEAAPCFA